MNTFSHIYIEKNLIGNPRAQKIIERFPQSIIVEIDHYKDVFCRGHQDFFLQKKHQALILACKQGELLYEGAKVCQSFGNSNFYYTSQIMNCIYNCEYCYLSGMYPSGNIVMFLNLEDYFNTIESYLKIHPMYICISYDTDLMALNPITGFLNEWIEFTDNHDNLVIEIRSKCGNLASVLDSLAKLKHKERIIFAYTLSPALITESYEHNTSSLSARISAIKKLQELDMPLRLAFDPMIYIPDWRQHYNDLSDTVFSEIDNNKILDISVGSFRISNEYLKKMRKNLPDSAIAQFPYVNENGVYHYPEKILTEMEEFMLTKCQQILPKEKIFLWKE